MKNIKIKILALSLLTSMTAIAAVSGTVSWFTGQTSIGPGGNILGSTQGAYFAGGDGLTAETAYQITNKYHVYNLAWLQYIEDDVHYFGGQRYFKVMNDIDMEGLAIPPIGTIENPFIGNFNGNSKVIHNFTIANVVANDGIKEKPGIVQNLNDANIIGFFGVVGKLPDTDLGEEITYSSTVNKVYNLSLENFKIKVGQTTGGNLIGLAAGYVNAKMENVAVGSSKFDIAQGVQVLTKARVDTAPDGPDSDSDPDDVYPTNLSNYSTVGYCTKNYLKKSNIVNVSAINPSVENGSVSGGGNNFGASIPMEDIYNHLLGVKGAGSSQLHSYTYPGSITEHYDYNGNLDDSRTTESNPQTPESIYGMSGSGYKYRHSGGTLEDSNGNTIASYTFANRENTDNFMYLSGEQTIKGYYLVYSSSNYDSGPYAIARNLTKWRIDNNNNYYTTVNGSNLYLGFNSNSYTFVISSNPTRKLTYSTSTKTLSANSRYLVIEELPNSFTYTRTESSGTTFERDSYVENGVTYYSFYAPFTATTYRYQDVKYSGIVISNGDSSNPHYLKATSNTTFTDSTTIDKYCFWTIDNSGRLKNDQYTCYLYSNNGNLAATNSPSTGENYVWTYDSTNHYLAVGGSKSNARDLKYDNGWKLVAPKTEYQEATYSDVISYFYVTYNNQKYYINASGTSRVVAQQNTKTTEWNYEADGKLYTMINNNKYYLAYISSSQVVGLSTSANYYYYYDSNNHKLYNATSATSSYKYYLTFNGSSFSESSGSGGSTFNDETSGGEELTPEVQVEHNTNITYRENKEVIVKDENELSSIEKSVSYTTGATYFPLQFTDDGTDIADTNTGYICGGANTSSFPEGDMRVSKYNYTSLSNSYGSETAQYNDNTAVNFEILTRTANSNGYVRIIDTYNAESDGSKASSAISSINKMTVQDLNLKKYNTARGYFHTSLKNGGSDIYGLHFMDAQISMDRLITVDRAMANGWEYLPDGTIQHHVLKRDEKGNPVKKVDEHGDPVKDKYGNLVYEYEIDPDDTIHGSHKYNLPEDCIDFNLSENGTINFFAGSYFSGNTAFFSLHHIKRFDDNPAQIQWIKEIRQVYYNSDYETEYNPVTNPDVPKYVYKYKDNSYSSGNAGDLIFDLSWITDIGSSIITNMTYYFEIPAIAGEYALGSVSGRTGAYLMYLDIGASGKSAEITVVKENVTTQTDTYALPDGVDYSKLTDGSGNPISASVQGGEVGTVVIPSGTYGDNITFSYNPTNKILTCGPPNSEGSAITNSTYIADGVSITCNGNDLTASYESTIKIEKDINTTYTYDIDNDRLYTDVFTVTTTTINGGTPSTDSGVNDPQIITYEVTEDVYESKYKLELVDSTGNVYFEVYYQADAEANITLKYLYTYNPETGRYNYILIVDTNVELKIHVVSVESGFDFTIRSITNAEGDTSDQAALAEQTYTVYAKEGN